MSKILITIIIIIIIAGLGYWVYQSALSEGSKECLNDEEGKCEGIFKEISSFDDCVKAGYPVMESYPRQCRTPEGKIFIEDIGNELEKIDLIRINTPRPNQTVNSPLAIKGEARGYWFFEADFPVKLLDANDKELGTAIAKTSSDWMTEDFVLFEAILEFQVPTTDKGVLILEKDNPSGLPENADELRIPVRFQTEKEQACINSGGKLSTSLCCKAIGDFPNLCLIGHCGCSPENSHQVKICDCGNDKCFNGKECIVFGNK